VRDPQVTECRMENCQKILAACVGDSVVPGIQAQIEMSPTNSIMKPRLCFFLNSLSLKYSFKQY